MGVIIHIEPEEIWQFFQKNKKRLKKEMVLIAENEDTGYALYLTEEDGLPLFSVCKDDNDPEYEEGAINEKDCTDTAKQCCVKYLRPVVVHSKKYASSPEYEDDDYWCDTPSKKEQDELIENRELELLFAMGDFLMAATNDNTCADGSDYVDTYGADLVMDVLDYFLQTLAEDYGLLVYRPTMVDDDDTGEEVLVEYPYNDPSEYEDDEAE